MRFKLKTLKICLGILFLLCSSYTLGSQQSIGATFFMLPKIQLERHPITGIIVPERWKPIIGYEGFYEISNYGRILSLERVDTNDHPVVEKILLPDLAKGYFRVTLCKDNAVNKRRTCHVLVAEHFIDNPDNLPCVNHDDGIKTHNVEFNLIWCTYSENTQHAYRTGLIKPGKPFLGRIGKLHPGSMPVLQSSNEGLPIKEWESACLAASTLGIQQANITAVCNGRRSLAGGFKWSKI